MLNFLKIRTVITDAEAVWTTGVALAAKFPAVQPDVDKVVADLGAVFTSLSFDAIGTVISDAKSLVTNIVSQFGATDPDVVAFEAAVAKLASDF